MKKEICKFYVIGNSIFAYITFLKGREKRVRINTELKIEKAFWDVKKGRPKSQYADYSKFNIQLDKIDIICNEVVTELKSKYANIENEPVTDIKTEFVEIYKQKKEPKKNIQNKFWTAYNEFIESKFNSITAKSIQRLELNKNILLEYQKHTGIEMTFESINETFKVKFESYLSKKNLSDNYISKIMSIVRQFMYFAFRKKYHTNLDYKYVTKSTNRADIFTLTESELNQLYNFDFESDRLNKTRDLFIFQTEICQRHSDIKNLNKGNFSLDNDGDEILTLRQQKTDTVVSIPLSPLAKQIISKYDYCLPVLSNQKFNDYIKQICKIAGIDEMVTIHVFKGGKKESLIKPKYEMITSHSARRSGASLLVEKGLPIPFVMKLTGHKTMTEFQKYINYSEKSVKNALKNIWKPENNLKVVSGGL
ncbi:MAG: tyrosine-type recombinase/integrase [Candidatus Kapabacteria bacterium]|nr:tyrosine-type recombinase/integrase [Candidatus Kapabacteria bacterium]